MAQLARDNLARSLAWDEEVRRQRYEQITSQRSSIDAEAAEAAAAKVSLLLAARAQLQDQGNGKA